MSRRAWDVGLAALVASLVGVVTGTGGAVSAQETCEQRVPWAISNVGVFESAESGTLETIAAFGTAPALTRVPSLVAGGTATAVGGGTFVAGVGAFLLGASMTCPLLEFELGGVSLGGYVDALTAVGLSIIAPGEPTTPPPMSSDIVQRSFTDCSSGVPIGGTSAVLAGGSGVDRCRIVRFPGFSSGRTGTAGATGTSGRYFVSNSATRTVGGNTLPAVVGSAAYAPVTTSDLLYTFMCSSTFAACDPGGPSDSGLMSVWLPDAVDSAPSGQARRFSTAMVQSERFGYYCAAGVTGRHPGIGGVCGVPPGRVLAVVNGVVPEIEAVWQPFPEVQTHGWLRRWVVETRCHLNTTATWQRVESEYFWDTTMHARVPLIKCPTGQHLTEYRVAQVPQGVACSATIAVGCETRYITERWTAPSSWLATGTAPAVIECLKAGNTCPPPDWDAGVCKWSTHTVDDDFCLPIQSTSAVELPTTPALDVLPPPSPGVVLSTAAPVEGPDEPGGGVTVTVPIDEGDGEPCDVKSEVLCSGGVVDLDSGEECFPNGWGWFNPAQWVLRPIKCALVWAFVPDSAVVQAKFAAFKESVFEQFPFSLIAAAMGFLGTLGDELENASGTGCFTGMGSFDIGGESVALDEMCIGDHVTIDTGKRQIMTVMFLSPMVWNLLRHAWGLVLGGRRSGDAE